MKKNKRGNKTDKRVTVCFDCEVNGMLTNFNYRTINSFIAFKRPILLKTDAIFCNGRKRMN